MLLRAYVTNSVRLNLTLSIFMLKLYESLSTAFKELMTEVCRTIGKFSQGNTSLFSGVGLVLFSHVWFFVTPWTSGSSVHGLLQARILEWVAISFSRGSSLLRDRTCVSCIGRGILYHLATWEDWDGLTGVLNTCFLLAALSATDLKIQSTAEGIRLYSFVTYYVDDLKVNWSHK